MRILGLDIGGTKCAVTACDTENGNITVLEKKVYKTDTSIEGSKMISGYYPTMHEYMEKYGCECIGISCGGPLDSGTGVIIAPPNLPNFKNVEIVKILEEEFSVPAFLQNDANACALAEWLFGAGKGTENMVFLTFGTGLGAGLILNGKLYEGTNGNAGEVGHIRLEPDGPFGFGKNGSFEGFCSGGGIAQIGLKLGREAHAKGIKTPYYDPENEADVNAKTISIAADNGDPTALEVYATSGKYLGKGLSVIIDILNPQRIVIGSILTRSKELLWDSCFEEMKKEALDVSLNVCEVVPALLHEQIGDFAAATVGAYGMENRK